MIRFKLLVLAVLLALATGLPAQADDATDRLLYFVLEKESVRLHFDYTIEVGYTVRAQTVITSSYLSASQHRSVSDLLDDLKKSNPDIDVSRDRKYPDVIHITEKSIKTIPDYPLLHKASRFSFDGKLMDLLRALDTATGSVLQCGNIMGGSVGGSAYLTSNVKISATNDEFRDVLTDASYSARARNDFGCLWESEMQMDSKGKLGIVIRFL